VEIKISKHISIKEATRSNTAERLGIDNFPNSPTLVNMQALAENVFEPLREHFGHPIYITSFYRSPELNKAIGLTRGPAASGGGGGFHAAISSRRT